MTPEEQKELIKQAIKEWLDTQKAAFGWWSLKTIGVAALMFFLTLWFTHNGVKLP